MQIDIGKYDFIVFDCDGVILNSNKLKTSAFRNSLFNYSEDKVSEFIKYHQNNGGISRYKKFDYFFSQIMKLDDYKDLLQIALGNYENILKNELISCSFVPGVIEFLGFLRNQKKEIYVNSGSSEDELKKIFKLRNIDKFFDEIKGSPNSKESNMNQIVISRNKNSKGLFFGDSFIDHEVANNLHIDFIFVSGYSEWNDIPDGLVTINDFSEINF